MVVAEAIGTIAMVVAVEDEEAAVVVVVEEVAVVVDMEDMAVGMVAAMTAGRPLALASSKDAIIIAYVLQLITIDFYSF
jgi:hypothetical protein